MAKDPQQTGADGPSPEEKGDEFVLSDAHLKQHDQIVKELFFCLIRESKVKQREDREMRVLLRYWLMSMKRMAHSWSRDVNAMQEWYRLYAELHASLETSAKVAGTIELLSELQLSPPTDKYVQERLMALADLFQVEGVRTDVNPSAVAIQYLLPDVSEYPRGDRISWKRIEARILRAHRNVFDDYHLALETMMQRVTDWAQDSGDFMGRVVQTAMERLDELPQVDRRSTLRERLVELRVWHVRWVTSVLQIAAQGYPGPESYKRWDLLLDALFSGNVDMCLKPLIGSRDKLSNTECVFVSRVDTGTPIDRGRLLIRPLRGWITKSWALLPNDEDPDAPLKSGLHIEPEKITHPTHIQELWKAISLKQTPALQDSLVPAALAVTFMLEASSKLNPGRAIRKFAVGWNDVRNLLAYEQTEAGEIPCLSSVAGSVDVQLAPDQHVALIRALQEALLTQWNLEFFYGQGNPKIIRFSRRRAGLITRIQGLLDTHTGVELCPSTAFISAGGRPEALIAHCDLDKPRNTEAFRSLQAALSSGEAWLHIRVNRDLDEVQELVRNAVNDGDNASVDDRSVASRWGRWLRKFAELFNTAAEDGALLCLGPSPSDDNASFAHVGWDWSTRDYSQPVRFCRSIELDGKTVQKSEIIRSQGIGPDSLLTFLSSDTMQLLQSHGVRETDVRSRVGREIVDHVGNGDRLNKSDKDSWTRTCRSLNAEFYPRLGDHAKPHHPEAHEVVGEEFHDDIEVGGCIRVNGYTLKFLDTSVPAQQFLQDPATGRLVTARVVLSKGKEPSLSIVLRELLPVMMPDDESSWRDALQRFHPDRLETQIPVIGLAQNCINFIQARLAATDGLPGADLLNLSKGLEDIKGFYLVPSVNKGGRYARHDVQARLDQMARIKSAPRLPIESVVAADSDSFRPSTADKDDFAALTGFAVAYVDENNRPALMDSRPVRWIKSLGPCSRQLQLGRDIVMELAPFAPLLEKMNEHTSIVAKLEAISEGAFRGEAPQINESNRCLLKLLNDADCVSDVAEFISADAARRLESIRNDILAFMLREPGVVIWPESPLRTSEKAGQQAVYHAVPGDHNEIVEVLQRHSAVDGEVLTAKARCGMGTAGINMDEWKLIQRLYTVLRIENGGSLNGLDEFLRLRDDYVKQGNMLAMLPLIQNAEMLGKKRLDRADPVELREAIGGMEQLLEYRRGIKRIDLRRWHEMPSGGKYSAYRTQKVLIRGRRPNLVVRILQPAYEDQHTGAINNLGLVLITE